MFHKVTEHFYASPQISIDDVAQAKEMGITLIINNRPEGESEDQTEGAQIEEAARAAGIKYIAIPVSHAGFSEAQFRTMASALADAQGPALAYCRSGTRSTLLWSLAEASRGTNPQKIVANAANAGYDVSPVRAMIDMLSAGAN